MKFKFAQCVLCGRDVFREDQVRAFGRCKPIRFVSLKGQAPWSGIGCICVTCLDELKVECENWQEEQQ